MPWFRIDDNLGFHHKVIAAGNPAMGLWVRAGSVCAQQLTDGFVPDHMVAALGTRAQAMRLVDVGLWDDVEGGFAFHEWAERQPSKLDVEAERAAAKERMRAARARKRQASQDTSAQVSEPRSPERGRNERRTSPEVRETFGNPDPALPDPTRPTGTDVPVSAAPQTESRFDEFWGAYDHKVGRKAAERAYAKALKKSGVTDDLLILAARSYIEWQRRTGKHPQYTKHAASWLNGEHWGDERAARERVTPRTRVQEHMALAEDLAGEQLRQIGAGQ